jgi:hypothetical protein
MRIALLVLAALLGAGFCLWRLLADHAGAALGVLGVLLLLVALFLPSEPPCSGFHCSGCKHH